MGYGVVESNIHNCVNRFNIDAEIARSIARQFWVDLQNSMQATEKIKIIKRTDDNQLVQVRDFDDILIAPGFALDFYLRIAVAPLSIDLPVSVIRIDGHQRFKMTLGREAVNGSFLYSAEVSNGKNPSVVGNAAKLFEQASKDWVCESLVPVVITL